MNDAAGGRPQRTFYRYRPDTDNFAGIGFETTDDEKIAHVHFTDQPLASSWTIPVAHGFDDNPENEGDFPTLFNFYRIPVMSQRAWKLLYPMLNHCCEALPLQHPNGHVYFMIHVMETIDCLDEAKCDLKRNATTGRVSRIFRYAFKPGMLNGKHIFKLPRDSGGELIVDDVFRTAVETNHLKGLRLVELAWSE